MKKTKTTKQNNALFKLTAKNIKIFRQIINMSFMFVILIFLVFLFVDHYKHPEMYAINNTYNQFSDAYTIQLQPNSDSCVCKEKILIQTLFFWIERIKWLVCVVLMLILTDFYFYKLSKNKSFI